MLVILVVEIKRYTRGEASDGMTLIPGFVKIGQLIQTLLGETNTCTHGWAERHMDLMELQAILYL
jgi:hypothetical protein